MKVLIAAMVIFVVLVGFATFASYYLNNTANTLFIGAESVEKSVDARDWQQAEKNFSQLNSSWNRTSPKWTTLIDHQELDNINISMSKAKKYMDTKDLPGSKTELAELKLLFKHIPEKEALNLKNIL
ncbi:MAG: DUF4363 family protein [Eubacteriales bacterium]